MTTVAGVTPLDGAREHLRAQLGDFDQLVDLALAAPEERVAETLQLERSVVSPLFDVADHTCRIGDHTSHYYRADKSGPLVRAALAVRGATLASYATVEGGSFGQVDPEMAEEHIRLLSDLAIEIEGGVGAAMWSLARGARPDGDDVSDLKKAIAQVLGLLEDLNG